MTSGGESKLAALAGRLGSEDPEQRRQAIVALPGGWVAGVLELLVRALGDTDWRVRKAAAARVMEWPDTDSAVAALCAALREEDDVGMRNAVVEALVGIGEPAAATLLGELDGDGAHRKFVVDTLGAIGTGAAVPAVVAALDDDDPNLRIAAAEALRNIGGVTAETALRACLTAADLQLRLAAIDGLTILEATIPVSEVMATLDQPILRKSALRLLGWSRDAAALPALVAALEERRPLRAPATTAIAHLLATIDGTGADVVASRLAELPAPTCRAVAELLDHPDVEVRRAAARVVGAAGAVESVAALVAGLLDPEMNRACREALLALGRNATAALLALTREAAPELQVELFDLLVAGGGDGAELESLLVAGLDDEDPEVSAAAARALGSLPALADPDAVCKALERALDRDLDEDVAGAAATALGRLGGAGVLVGARPLLEAALDSPAAELRAAAALALAELRDPSVVDRLAGHLADQDSYARLAAIRALATTGEAGRRLLGERLRRETDAEMVEAIRAALDDQGGGKA